MLSKTVTNQTVFSWPEPGSNITMTLMRLRQWFGKLIPGKDNIVHNEMFSVSKILKPNTSLQKSTC